MARVFDRNIFIMLLSIMIGVCIITYFAADIKARSEEGQKFTVEIASIEEKNINFTNYFIKSSVILDQARENRAFGNYHFDLAFLWYQSALSEKNNSTMNLFKSRGIDNCTNAMPYYENSRLNFEEAKQFFIDTRSLTEYPTYTEVLDLYISLTDSGAKLTILRYNASLFLSYLTESLTFDAETNNVTYVGIENITEMLMFFEETMAMYSVELEIFEEIKEEIDEYEFFDEIR